MHPFVIDAQGNLYVDLGSATNSCQSQNRMPNSPGNKPCTELETRGGTWRYDANKLDQRFSPAERFSTGLRNGEGFSFDSAGRIFATQHGRDQLAREFAHASTSPFRAPTSPPKNWSSCGVAPTLAGPNAITTTTRRSWSWRRNMAATAARRWVCAQKQEPAAAFPAHWAPNDLLIYEGSQFPSAYKDGAFIAFHGSWNRAPSPQGGYNVVFQPLIRGKASGTFVVFADGFAGAVKEPGQAAHRPTGLAVGPDGALYIADDGRPHLARHLHGDPCADRARAAPSSPPRRPQRAVRLKAFIPMPAPCSASLPLPARRHRAEVALGDRIFHGQAAGGTCAGCHGSDAKGSRKRPRSSTAIGCRATAVSNRSNRSIANGVPKPRNYSDPMPPKGGAALSDSDVAAVAAYVWAISHPAGK